MRGTRTNDRRIGNILKRAGRYSSGDCSYLPDNPHGPDAFCINAWSGQTAALTMHLKKKTGLINSPATLTLPVNLELVINRIL